MLNLRAKFVVVVQVDGLDEEGFEKELSEYGNVFDKEDKYLDEDTPVKMFYVDATFGKYNIFKMKYNCVEPRRYVLFPMASYEDMMKIKSEWKES